MGGGYAIAPRRVGESERCEATRASGLIDARARCRLDELVLWARVAVGTQMAAITAVAGEELHVVAASGLAVGVYQRNTSICTFTIAEPSSLLCVPDTQLDPRFAGGRYVEGHPWVRFYAGSTLMTPAGVALGALCVFDPRPRTGLLAREAQALTEIAAEVMRRLETSR